MSTKKAQATPTAASVRLAKQLTAESNMKVLWGCEASEHLYEARVSDRTRRNHGCPVCADGSTNLTAADTISSFEMTPTSELSLPDPLSDPIVRNALKELTARLIAPADHVERGADEEASE
jgi:hypothetical protein